MVKTPVAHNITNGLTARVIAPALRETITAMARCASTAARGAAAFFRSR
jgi:hypothetical protein